MSHLVTVSPAETAFRCDDGESVLGAMQRASRTDIPVGCRGGGCGACRIRVVEGDYTSRRMSRAHISEEDERNGVVLACRISPTSDLRITLPS